jgi:hypothetical protein
MTARSTKNLGRLPEGPEESAPHALLITEPYFPGHRIYRMAANFHHHPC